jgi:signal transduction histidine kinase
MRDFRIGPPERADPVIFAPFKVAVRQDDGRWLTVQPKPTFRWSSWQGRVLLTLLLSILVISPLAWLFARRLSQPFAAFAEGAERLGRDPNAPPLDISGSGEVASAVAAFNGMQERLRRYVHDRTAMVGAIAHDMRTPLTRMRFRIEGAPEELKGKLEQDIDQMEAMVAAALGFVHDTTAPAERTKLELASLVESVIDEAAETGADAAIESGERIVVEGDPLALKRMVANLVENAVKYGGAARGRVFAENGQAVIEIDDEGPGVRPSEMERVFDPFYRGEPSRSRETGGAGLGLAVVRSIARAHGGEATLKNRPDKGLTARVALPL